MKHETPGPGLWLLVAALLAVVTVVALGLLTRLTHP